MVVVALVMYIDTQTDALKARIDSASAGAADADQVDYALMLFRANAIHSDLVTARWAGGVAFIACVIAILSASFLWARRDRPDALFYDEEVVRRGLLLRFSYNGEAWYAYLTAWKWLHRKMFVVPIDRVYKIG
jgi:hypothetical protein